MGQVLSTALVRNDGPGDEVYLTSLAQTLRRSDRGIIQTFPIMLSAVHGDVVTWPQDNRARAGTASGWGGLRAGDVIAPMVGPAAGGGWPMFVLWEGQPTDGVEDLVVHPVLWEADEPDNYGPRWIGHCPYDPKCSGNLLVYWARHLVNNSNGSSEPEVRAALLAPQIVVAAGDFIWISGGEFKNLELQKNDRPIGLENDGSVGTSGITGRWRDVQVVLSREKIEAAIKSGNNVISIRMWDRTALNGVPPTYHPQLGGDDMLMLRVERAP